MNLPRFIPELDTTTPLQLREGELRITSTGFTETNRPLWVHLGPAAIMLTEQEAIDVGTALIQAAHHRRAVLAAHQPPVVVDMFDGDQGEVLAVRP